MAVPRLTSPSAVESVVRRRLHPRLDGRRPHGEDDGRGEQQPATAAAAAARAARAACGLPRPHDLRRTGPAAPRGGGQPAPRRRAAAVPRSGRLMAAPTSGPRAVGAGPAPAGRQQHAPVAAGADRAGPVRRAARAAPPSVPRATPSYSRRTRTSRSCGVSRARTPPRGRRRAAVRCQAPCAKRAASSWRVRSYGSSPRSRSQAAYVWARAAVSRRRRAGCRPGSPR